MKTIAVILALCLGPLPMQASAPAPDSAVAAAKSYGFTDAEIERVLHGEVLSKGLKEGSNKELAGVAAIWLPTPLAEFAEITFEGKLLQSDASIRSLHVWKLNESADQAFADLPVDAAQHATLKARYEAYRKTGLRDILPSGPLLTLAIKETRSLERLPGYAKALLDFSADPLPGMEHRFFAYQQDVEGRPTLILSHRAAVRGTHDALITEQRYFVSQSYDCRFIVSDCFEARGGTLLFCVNRIFTERVSGVGSSLKHSMGRARLLSTVAAHLKRDRERLKDVNAGQR